jgi:hypothetical protein
MVSKAGCDFSMGRNYQIAAAEAEKGAESAQDGG